MTPLPPLNSGNKNKQEELFKKLEALKAEQRKRRATPVVKESTQPAKQTSMESYGRGWGQQLLNVPKALYEGTKDLGRSVVSSATSYPEVALAYRDWDEVEKREKYQPFSSFTPVQRSDYLRWLEEQGKTPDVAAETGNRLNYLRQSDTKYADYLQKTRSYVQDKWKADPTYKSGGWIEDFFRMGPQIAAQVAAHATTGGVGSGILMFAQLSGGKTQALLDAGVDLKTATSAGLIDAAIQLPFEQFGMNSLFKAWPVQRRILGKIKAMGLSYATEFATEYLQSYPDLGTTLFAQNPDKKLLEKIEQVVDVAATWDFQGGAAKEASIAALWGAALAPSGKSAVDQYNQYLKAKQDKAVAEVEAYNARPRTLRDIRKDIFVEKEAADAKTSAEIESLLNEIGDVEAPPKPKKVQEAEALIDKFEGKHTVEEVANAKTKVTPVAEEAPVTEDAAQTPELVPEQTLDTPAVEDVVDIPKPPKIVYKELVTPVAFNPETGEVLEEGPSHDPYSPSKSMSKAKYDKVKTSFDYLRGKHPGAVIGYLNAAGERVTEQHLLEDIKNKKAIKKAKDDVAAEADRKKAEEEGRLLDGEEADTGKAPGYEPTEAEIKEREDRAKLQASEEGKLSGVALVLFNKHKKFVKKAASKNARDSFEREDFEMALNEELIKWASKPGRKKSDKFAAQNHMQNIKNDLQGRGTKSRSTVQRTGAVSTQQYVEEEDLTNESDEESEEGKAVDKDQESISQLVETTQGEAEALGIELFDIEKPEETLAAMDKRAKEAPELADPIMKLRKRATDTFFPAMVRGKWTLKGRPEAEQKAIIAQYMEEKAKEAERKAQEAAEAAKLAKSYMDRQDLSMKGVAEEAESLAKDKKMYEPYGFIRPGSPKDLGKQAQKKETQSLEGLAPGRTFRPQMDPSKTEVWKNKKWAKRATAQGHLDKLIEKNSGKNKTNPFEYASVDGTKAKGYFIKIEHPLEGSAGLMTMPKVDSGPKETKPLREIGVSAAIRRNEKELERRTLAEGLVGTPTTEGDLRKLEERTTARKSLKPGESYPTKEVKKPIKTPQRNEVVGKVPEPRFRKVKAELLKKPEWDLVDVGSETANYFTAEFADKGWFVTPKEGDALIGSRGSATKGFTTQAAARKAAMKLERDQKKELIETKKPEVVKAKKNKLTKTAKKDSLIVKRLEEEGVVPKVEPEISLKGAGEGIVHNLYSGLFEALKEGKDTFAGVKDPVLAKAKKPFEEGKIKSAEDLRKFVNSPEYNGVRAKNKIDIQEKTDKLEDQITEGKKELQRRFDKKHKKPVETTKDFKKAIEETGLDVAPEELTQLQDMNEVEAVNNVQKVIEDNIVGKKTPKKSSTTKQQKEAEEGLIGSQKGEYSLDFEAIREGVRAALKGVKDYGETIGQTIYDKLDVEAPFVRMGAPKVGRAFKNYFSKVSMFEIQGAEDAQDFMDTVFHTQAETDANGEIVTEPVMVYSEGVRKQAVDREGKPVTRIITKRVEGGGIPKPTKQQLADIVFAYENKDYQKGLPKEYQLQLAPAIQWLSDFFEGEQSRFTEHGLEPNFIDRRIQELEKKYERFEEGFKNSPIKSQKETIKGLDLLEQIETFKQMRFAAIPMQVMFDKALTKARTANKLQRKAAVKSVLNWKSQIQKTRRATSLYKMSQNDKFKDLNFNPVDIIMNYAYRGAKDLALIEIRDEMLNADKPMLWKVRKGKAHPAGWKILGKRYGLLAGYYAPDHTITALEGIFSVSDKQGAYDKFIGATKMMQFFNPIFLPTYDVYQSIMSGVWYGKQVKYAPKYVRLAAKSVLSKDSAYQQAMSLGLFSKPFDMPRSDFNSIMARIGKSHAKMPGSVGLLTKHGRDYLNQQAHNMKDHPMAMFFASNPVYQASFNIAWGLDEMVRMTTYQALVGKGFKPEEAAQLAAKFHGDYASVPPNTRRMLNKLLFTPTFKIVMGKYYAGAIKNAIRHPLMSVTGKGVAGATGRAFLGIISVNVGFDMFMRTLGYKPDDEEKFGRFINYGRKYRRTTEDGFGPAEIVFTWSTPANLLQRYAQRVMKAWSMKQGPIKSLYGIIKWDMHPMFNIIDNAANNRTFGGTEIYHKNDSGYVQNSKVALYMAGEFVKLYGTFFSKAAETSGGDMGGSELSTLSTVRKEQLALNDQLTNLEIITSNLMGMANYYVRTPKDRRLSQELVRNMGELVKDMKKANIQGMSEANKEKLQRNYLRVHKETMKSLEEWQKGREKEEPEEMTTTEWLKSTGKL